MTPEVRFTADLAVDGGGRHDHGRASLTIAVNFGSEDLEEAATLEAPDLAMVRGALTAMRRGMAETLDACGKRPIETDGVRVSLRDGQWAGRVRAHLVPDQHRDRWLDIPVDNPSSVDDAIAKAQGALCEAAARLVPNAVDVAQFRQLDHAQLARLHRHHPYIDRGIELLSRER